MDSIARGVPGWRGSKERSVFFYRKRTKLICVLTGGTVQNPPGKNLSFIAAWQRFYNRPRILGKSRDEFIFQEGRYRMVIYAERMLTGLAIDFESVHKWLPPHENEVITQDERFEILERICRCLDNRHVKYTVFNYGYPEREN